MDSPKDRRLALGKAAVLTLSSAAELLPWRESEAIAWLRRRGLVRVVGLGEVVIWGDVLEEIKTEAAELAQPKPIKVKAEQAARVGGLGRVEL